MKSESEEDEIVSGINVTPLVDVCLVLVIIFIVTAPLMSEPVIKVSLPKAHTKQGEESDKITVTLAKDGRLALDYREYKDFAEMEDELKGRLMVSDTKHVVLKADEDAAHGRLVELMAKAKEAGAAVLTIATEPKK